MGETKMIYAILDKTKNLIYFSDKQREEEELEWTELLYTSNIVSLEDIKKNLRPWVSLLLDGYYKNTPEIKEYLETGKTNEFYTKVYAEEINEEIEDFLNDLYFLKNIECIPQNIDNYENIELKRKIIYDCDIYNYLETVFGRDLLDIVYSYKSLGKCEQDFLKEFSRINTKDKKFEYLEKNISGLNQDVLEFLPLWYRLSYKISGKSKPILEPEYKNQETLGRGIDEEVLRDKFFNAFKLNEIYTGKSIKSKIQEIYNKLGISKTPKISDLHNYFEITSVSSLSSYRIDLRK